MIIDFYETFDMPPGNDFATLSWQSAMPALNYNSPSAAVDLTAGLGGSAWVFTGLSVAPEHLLWSFEADLELISDASARKHIGLWLVQDGDLVKGYRITHLDGGWTLSKFSSWIGSSEVNIPFTLVSNPTFNAGERKRIKAEKNGSSISIYVNDVLIFSASDSSYTHLRPGIFFYGCTVRVHSIAYKINGDLIYSSFPVTMAWANQETKMQAWPGENSCKQLDPQTAEKAYGVTAADMLKAPPLRKDFGFIEGVITRKSTPAAGKHVICLDERFNLIAETSSAANGYYRFDSLPINGLYAIHAYDNDIYQYAPVGADRRTPEAYP